MNIPSNEDYKNGILQMIINIYNILTFHHIMEHCQLISGLAKEIT